MKGFLYAVLLVALQPMTVAQAFEADIHYAATYVLARAQGWPEADALTIASANQAVDENQDTVAALEVDATASASVAGYVMSSPRQAQRNLMFHCFSSTRERGARISADVLEVISGRFAEIPGHDETPRKATQRLIALGVALHCQQDAHAHAGFGGSCGSHSGSCHGHTYQTVLDQVVFGLLRKHFYNPDHPGVSGARLLETLQGTARELAARRPKGATRSIPFKALVALSDELRRSGLDLPDEVRRDCNRYIAGKWLFNFLRSASRDGNGRGAVEKLAPEVAGTCRNASLASGTIVSIPAPRFPRLNADASAYRVAADGTYQLVRGGEFAASLPRAPAPDYHADTVRVQVSHWRQLLAFSPFAASATAGRASEVWFPSR